MLLEIKSFIPDNWRFFNVGVINNSFQCKVNLTNENISTERSPGAIYF